MRNLPHAGSRSRIQTSQSITTRPNSLSRNQAHAKRIGFQRMSHLTKITLVLLRDQDLFLVIAVLVAGRDSL